jgi:TctA family transporter
MVGIIPEEGATVTAMLLANLTFLGVSMIGARILPLVMGLILGKLVEESFSQTMIM